MGMKYILKMAFRNIGRNKRRTMLSAIAISIAVIVVLVMQGYIGGVMDSMFDSLAKIETGHIKLVHPEYHDKEEQDYRYEKYRACYVFPFYPLYVLWNIHRVLIVFALCDDAIVRNSP